MNADASYKTWFERLSHVFLRPKNPEKLLDWLAEAAQEQLIEPEAVRMIEGVLQVYDLQVRDVMVPKSQMIVLHSDATLEQLLPIVIDSAHSRFPVVAKNTDEVIGILLAKDLLPYTSNPTNFFHLETLLRPSVFIPESKRLNILLEEFRLNRNHIAIVVDEYGGVVGMLSIEDVLEEIVGEIEDEYDIDEPQTNITPIHDSQYNVKGLTPVEQFNHFFETHFTDANSHTIGDFIRNIFGYLPKRGEKTRLEDLEFKISYADKRKIRLLQVTRCLPDDDLTTSS